MNSLISPLFNHDGINQTYAKMQLIYHCKSENKIYLTKLSDEKCADGFLHQVIRFNTAQVIINKEIKLFLLIISKLGK